MHINKKLAQIIVFLTSHTIVRVMPGELSYDSHAYAALIRELKSDFRGFLQS